MSNRNNTLTHIVIDYLKGKPLDEIKVRLQIECTRAKTGCKSLYKSILLDKDIQPHNTIRTEDPQETSAITTANSLTEQSLTINNPDKSLPAILGCLDIKKEDASRRYECLIKKSNNLYDLLLLLYHDGEEHLEILLELIEKTKPKYQWTKLLMLSTFISAGLGGLTLFKKEYFERAYEWFSSTFPSIIRWFSKTFSILRNLPLLGILYNGLDLILSWYNTFSNSTTTPTIKLHQLFFKTLAASITLAAHTLSFLAADEITLTAAIFFILASSTKVIQGIFNGWNSSKSLQDLHKIDPLKTTWAECANYERARIFHHRLLTSVYTNIGAAIVTTLTVSMWCFFPPNLFLTIFCIACISFTYLTEQSLLTHIKETYADVLQTAIEDIKTPCPANLTPNDQENATKIESLSQDIRANIQSRERILDKRKKLLIAFVNDISQRSHRLFQGPQNLDENPPVTPLFSTLNA